MKRLIVPFLCCFVIICSASFSFAGKSSSKVVKIAIMGDFSGQLKAYADGMFEAAKVVVNKANKAGGVKGRRVVLVKYDDGCAKGSSEVVAKKIIVDKIKIVVGPLCSNVAAKALPLFQKAGVICVAPTVTVSWFNRYPNFFRTIESDLEEPRGIIRCASQEGLSNLVVLDDGSSFGVRTSEIVLHLAKDTKDIRFTRVKRPSGESLNMSQVAKIFLGKSYDGVVYGGYGEGVSQLVAALKAFGVAVPVIASSAVVEDRTIPAAVNYGGDFFVSSFRDFKKLPSYQAVIREYQAEHHNTVPAFYFTSYAGVQAALKALKTSDDWSYPKLLKAMQNTSIQSPFGPLGFDKKGETTVRMVSLFKATPQGFVQIDK